MKAYQKMIAYTAVFGVLTTSLKYFDYISVSWWGATAPFWWWIAVGLIGLVLYGILYLIGMIIKNKQNE